MGPGPDDWYPTFPLTVAEAGFRYVKTHAKQGGCRAEHNWLGPKTLAHCRDAVMSDVSCSHEYFNHATGDDDNCACAPYGVDCEDPTHQGYEPSVQIYKIETPTCSVTDGSGVSNSYPCKCGKAKCPLNYVCTSEIDQCQASNEWCGTYCQRVQNTFGAATCNEHNIQNGCDGYCGCGSSKCDKCACPASECSTTKADAWVRLPGVYCSNYDMLYTLFTSLEQCKESGTKFCTWTCAADQFRSLSRCTRQLTSGCGAYIEFYPEAEVEVPTPAPTQILSDGSAVRPHCSFNSSSPCKWDAATQSLCAVGLCKASDYDLGVLVSAEHNPCTTTFTSVGGGYYIDCADGQNKSGADRSWNGARIVASCSQAATLGPTPVPIPDGASVPVPVGVTTTAPTEDDGSVPAPAPRVGAASMAPKGAKVCGVPLFSPHS